MTKVAVGMSGGVDSAVAAYLLKEQGYDVVGVTLRTFGSDEGDGLGGSSRCCEIDDARAAAARIGIPYHVFNVSSEFERKVVAPFVQSYCSGTTPNPCVICNRVLKWEHMMYAAKVLGAEKIATGHYASIVRLENGRYTVRTAEHAAKDQSYMLYRLSQEQLAATLMPLGPYSKEQVRKIAAEIGLEIAGKPDSQEICFVPDDDYAGFIKRWIERKGGAEPSWQAAGTAAAGGATKCAAQPGGIEAEKPAGTADPFAEGDFVDEDGRVLGRHRGIVNYTVGQRKGLGIALGYPAYVLKIDPARNQVVLGPQEALFTDTVRLQDVNYMGLEGLKAGESVKVLAKVRYQHPAAEAVLAPAEPESGAAEQENAAASKDAVKQGQNSLRMEAPPEALLRFASPVKAAAPGQSAVFYDADGRILGGGIIK